MTSQKTGDEKKKMKKYYEYEILAEYNLGSVSGSRLLRKKGRLYSQDEEIKIIRKEFEEEHLDWWMHVAQEYPEITECYVDLTGLP